MTLFVEIKVISCYKLCLSEKAFTAIWVKQNYFSIVLYSEQLMLWFQ